MWAPIFFHVSSYYLSCELPFPFTWDPISLHVRSHFHACWLPFPCMCAPISSHGHSHFLACPLTFRCMCTPISSNVLSSPHPAWHSSLLSAASWQRPQLSEVLHSCYTQADHLLRSQDRAFHLVINNCPCQSALLYDSLKKNHCMQYVQVNDNFRRCNFLMDIQATFLDP